MGIDLQVGDTAGPAAANAPLEPPMHEPASNGRPPRKARPSLPAPAHRQLRGRPSDPGPSTKASSLSSTPLRRPTEKELEQIHKRLGPDSVLERRDEVIKRKEEELKSVIDGHDDAVRERFHLERFVSILEGYDPVDIKSDNSPVFVEWRDRHHNLRDLISNVHVNAEAGPSRPHASGPVRTTRRQAHEQAELFPTTSPLVTVTTTPVPVRTKGRVSHLAPNEVIPVSPVHIDVKGKGKAKAIEGSPTTGKPLSSRFTVAEKPTENGEMLPPPVPKGKKAGRRATMHGGSELPLEQPESKLSQKAKKRARASLPTLSQSAAPDEDLEIAESPAIEPEVVDEPIGSPPPAHPPAPQLPSLAHVPFPPPPKRSYARIRGRRKPYYTDPSQIPPPTAKYGGNIAALMHSYIHIEDTGPPPDLKTLELRAAREAYVRNRVNYLQHQGRLLRLLEGDEFDMTAKPTKVIPLPPRQTDHQDSLLAHMVQVRNAMLNEAKAKPVVCKRIARMIQLYWEREENKEERERQAEEKERKRIMKDLMKALRKKWGLAVKIVRAKLIEAQKAEQDRLGKEHLQNMLQRSTGLLEAQRDDIVGKAEGEEEEEDNEEDAEEVDGGEGEESPEEDGGSSGTEDVSAAEDSEDEEEPNEAMETQHMDMDVDPVPESEPIAASLDRETSPAIPDELAGSEAGAENDDGALSSDEADEEEEEEEEEDDGSSPPDESVDLSMLLTDELDNPPSDTLRVDIGPGSSVPTQREAINGASALEQDIPTTGVPTVGELTPSTAGEPAETLPTYDSTDPNPSAVRLIRSRRERKSLPLTPVSQTEDPDANDIEFKAEATSEADEQDLELDVEMEDEDEVKEEDSEEEGLLADADLPIDELLKRYGYSVPNGHGDTAVVDPTAPTPDTENATITDKSLMDDALPDDPTPESLIVQGKRQRRVRSVWTPEENPPHPVKKPKIEVVEQEESTPELSTDEEDEDEGEEEDEAVSETEDLDPNRVRPPFLLRGTLRPYQQAGLEWLASLYANNMNGILADEMGLGKTIQTISLLGHLACDKGVWGQHLIIVPTSVILNWEMEFKKFLPGLKVLTYYGNQKERKEKRVGWHTEHAWQVCITSYQIVLADQHIFRRKSWVYMILDEAHNIKNFRSQRWQTLLGFKAQRRLLLTGTPLQNNLMELWSLLYFLMPNGITADATAVVGFANHKEFSEWFSNPMDKAIETGDALDEETLETVAKLHTLLRPFILRRLKSEVETQLPGKFEHVVYCRLSKRQRFLYDEFMSRASTKEALTSGGYLGVVNTLMQLRKVCNHPDLFEVRPVRTSFAMERSVLADYEPAELIIRKRMLQREDELSLEAMNLNITALEGSSAWACGTRSQLDASDQLPYAVENLGVIKKGRQPAPPKPDTLTVDGWLKYQAYLEEQKRVARWRSLRDINRMRCAARPIYGSTLLDFLSDVPDTLLPLSVPTTRHHRFGEHYPPVAPLVQSLTDRSRAVEPLINNFAVIPPNAVARDVPQYALPGLTPSSHSDLLNPDFDTLHTATVKLQIAFPDASLLQYDCGKLQKLYEMLRDLKANGHRVLIFTQMTRVLDILEIFLSYNGHRYLRLDGSTKIEDRQIITERFNSDSRIFVFIASSRSGGVGINLTGADTVFFYDSDWNPSMDRQCMDRAHRIGQTREVHIYRFVSSHTVEENMLRKANQKRLLDRVVIQEGDFTTEFFGKMDWRDIIEQPESDRSGAEKATLVEADEERVEDVQVEGTPVAIEAESAAPRLGEEREFAKALAAVEDEEDAEAARIAQGEGEMDLAEFTDKRAVGGEQSSATQVKKKVGFELEEPKSKSASGTPLGASVLQEADGAGVGDREDMVGVDQEDEGMDEDEEEEEEIGGVEEYMLKVVEWDWDWFAYYRP